MDLMELMTVVEKKAPAAICRKIIEAKISKKKKSKFGVMASKQEVLCLLMTVLKEF